ncbi:hypothetical protein GIB67_042537 [Kingdonia uniflora]|uniref:glycerol-3-phosphate 1-O-acyltransferase n=1 Tax=Kingdonia uniflora TaxID=39325 RepID=A0A7J7M1C6_9MAGN|nr:hypothetical protein GIB67_042537 [Kingdonia uniflora]
MVDAITSNTTTTTTMGNVSNPMYEKARIHLKFEVIWFFFSHIMLIVSSYSSPSSSVCVSISKTRVSSGVSRFSSARIWSNSSTVVKYGVRCCSCVSKSRKVKVGSMAELVEDKESVEDNVVIGGHSRCFIDAESEEELLSGVRKETKAGRLPSNVAAGLEELYKNYRSAVKTNP